MASIVYVRISKKEASPVALHLSDHPAEVDQDLRKHYYSHKPYKQTSLLMKSTLSIFDLHLQHLSTAICPNKTHTLLNQPITQFRFLADVIRHITPTTSIIHPLKTA